MSLWKRLKETTDVSDFCLSCIIKIKRRWKGKQGVNHHFSFPGRSSYECHLQEEAAITERQKAI